MKLLDRFLNTTPDTVPQKVGRHSEAGIIDRLTQEIAGYKEALQLAGRDLSRAQQEAAKHKAWFQKADRGWRSADAEVQRLRVLLGARTEDPEPASIPAAVDRPDFQPEPADPPTPARDRDQLPPIALSLPRPETYEPASLTDETRRDESLQSLALPGEEEMAAELEAMRSANLTATVTLPAIPDRPAIADPAERALNITAPNPLASATSVPVGLGDRISVKVRTTLDEAS